MAPRRHPLPYESRQQRNLAEDARLTTTSSSSNGSRSSANSIEGVNALRRTLPPLQHGPVDRTRTSQPQTLYAIPQLGTLQRNPYITQPQPAARSHGLPSTTMSQPYYPVLPSVQMASTTPQSPYSASPGHSGAGMSRAPVSGFPTSYGSAAYHTYPGNNMQPPGASSRSVPPNLLRYEGSMSQPASVAPSSAFAPSQVRQSVPAVPPTQASSDNITSRYRFHVRQQPVAARACGFGERDRRVIDPPPIVQLSLAGYDPSSPSDVAELEYPQFVVHCTLLSASATGGAAEDVTAVPEQNNAEKLTRKMTGTLVASPFPALDPDKPALADRNTRLACFFIFSDLSCRQVGRYRLKFRIMKVGPEQWTDDKSIPVQRSVESDKFEVYSAKDFPGMRASTPLIKELRRQGAAVSVKKGIEARRREHNTTSSSVSTASGNEESDTRARVAMLELGQRQRRR